MSLIKSFASDNTSGAHPRILDAMARANRGAAPSYGEDAYTQDAVACLRDAFGPSARPWFVFLGTAANVLGLKSVLRPQDCVLCADTAHINTDECGAPEAVAGCKLLLMPSRQGKIRAEDCLPHLSLRESVHNAYPRVLSLTQATECGTLYSVDELRAVGDFCRKHALIFHMDGARLCNAAAALGTSLKELSADVGVDVLSFGGAKNGLMFGEAVIFLNDALGHGFAYIRKQHMQLMAKMRFLAVQFLEYLQDGLWLENARAANGMAALLAAEISGMDHLRVVYPVEANAVFVRLHKKAIARLQERFYFYTFDAKDAEGFPKDWHMARLMTSYDTTEEEVRAFARAIGECHSLR